MAIRFVVYEGRDSLEGVGEKTGRRAAKISAAIASHAKAK
jgi:hypothetical protein